MRVMEQSVERMFQAEEATNAKALQKLHIHSIGGTARRQCEWGKKVFRGRRVKEEVRSDKKPDHAGPH